MEAKDIADNDAVRAIRDHSRYLMPNGKFDLVVSLGILLRGLIVNVVNVATIVYLAAAILLLLCPDQSNLHDSVALEGLRSLFAKNVGDFVESSFGRRFLATEILLLLFAIWLVLFAIYRSFVGVAARASPELQSDPGSWPARATGAAIIAICVIFFLEVQRPIVQAVLRWFGTEHDIKKAEQHIEVIFLAMAAGTGVVGITFRFFLNALQDAQKNASWASFFKALTARSILYISAAILPALIYGVFLWIVLLGLADHGKLVRAPDFLIAKWSFDAVSVALLPVFLVVALVTIEANFGAIPNSVCSPTWWKTSAFRTGRFYLTAVWLIGVFLIWQFVFGRWLIPVIETMLHADLAGWKYAAIATWLALIAFFFSENGNSLHRLYRDRLQEAFAIEKGFSSSPLKLSDLKAVKPYPIVNATINLGSGSKKNKRARNADYFIFTPHHIGSDATGYVEAEEFEKAEPHLDLATAIAISGAAVSTAMGRVGVAVLAPTLALLNLRLGFWMRNPLYAHSEEARELASRGDWTLSYVFAESFGLLNEDMKKVYVTDGGHIDNLGLHELLKRRCRYIIVSDAEADPAMEFPALVDAERFARIDLGVRIDIPIEPLRAAALKRKADNIKDPITAASAPAYAHAAIGKILYPPTAGLDNDEGTILYVKSTVTGNESSYILDYERRNPKFPHEPTSDQFFSEEQFEAYRALGFHAMTNALDLDDGSPNAKALRADLLQGLGLPVPPTPPAPPTEPVSAEDLDHTG